MRMRRSDTIDSLEPSGCPKHGFDLFREDLARGFSPVDRLDVAPFLSWPLPPLPLCAPGAVRAALRLDESERVLSARVVETYRGDERPEPGEHVVVPVRREVELHQRRVGRFSSAMRVDD